MIDVGLLLSMLVAVGLPVLLSTRWLAEPQGFFDRILGPLLVGVAVGRIVTVAIDDPGAFGRFSDLLIVRSGVEFWPAVAAATALFALAAWRGRRPVGAEIAAVAPLAMIGYAGYEATCVLRSGCYGPESPIGLSPPGVTATMFPIGWLAAALIVGGAMALRTRAERLGWSGVVIGAGAVVAGVRSTVSFWLPHVGEGLSRQHWLSIAVAVCSLAIAVWLSGAYSKRAPE